MSIAERLLDIRNTIAGAARRSGRSADAVRLIAVSKGIPFDAIADAHAAGQRDFGENYVQELVQKNEAKMAAAKHSASFAQLTWHFIGQLQRNKANKLATIADVVHTLDRVDVVRELDRRAGAAGRRLDVLVEVNTGGESTKGGCAPDGAAALVETIAACAHLRAIGLMTIPPPVATPDLARPFFAALRELRDRHRSAGITELSMGMSHDFEVAIEEGATIVRVGTAIFGARRPKT